MENKYKVGNRFRHKDGDEYILARIGYSDEDNMTKVNLISLSNGNMWSKPYRVKDTNNITESELRNLLGSGEYRFNGIGNNFNNAQDGWVTQDKMELFYYYKDARRPATTIKWAKVDCDKYMQVQKNRLLPSGSPSSFGIEYLIKVGAE